MTISTNIIRRAIIDEICAQRALALDLYAQLVETLKAARTAYRDVAAGKAYLDELDFGKLCFSEK